MKKGSKEILASSPVSGAYAACLELAKRQRKERLTAEKVCIAVCLKEVRKASTILTAAIAFNMVCFDAWWTEELLGLLQKWLDRCQTATEARSISEAIGSSLPRGYRDLAKDRWQELSLKEVESATTYGELVACFHNAPKADGHYSFAKARMEALSKALALCVTFAEVDKASDQLEQDFDSWYVGHALRDKCDKLRTLSGGDSSIWSVL